MQENHKQTASAEEMPQEASRWLNYLGRLGRGRVGIILALVIGCPPSPQGTSRVRVLLWGTGLHVWRPPSDPGRLPLCLLSLGSGCSLSQMASGRDRGIYFCIWFFVFFFSSKQFWLSDFNVQRGHHDSVTFQTHTQAGALMGPFPAGPGTKQRFARELSSGSPRAAGLQMWYMSEAAAGRAWAHSSPSWGSHQPDLSRRPYQLPPCPLGRATSKPHSEDPSSNPDTAGTQLPEVPLAHLRLDATTPPSDDSSILPAAQAENPGVILDSRSHPPTVRKSC